MHTLSDLGMGTQSFSSSFSSLHSANFLFFLFEHPVPSNEQSSVVFTAIKLYPSEKNLYKIVYSSTINVFIKGKLVF